MEATEVSIDRWMDKEDVAHIYNGILLSHKKKQNWVICSEVDESVIQSEVSQKEKNKYRMLTHIYGIYMFEPWSGKIPHAAEQLSPCAATTEPVL